jgi:EAL domain-containing protein (putative c-di-GMP-specific phosphodiesterase class I)
MKKLTDDEDSTLITKSMILLAKSLHLDVLAEGVETEQQKEFLLDNGCDEIQGFIYTQPMTAQKMEDTFLK